MKKITTFIIAFICCSSFIVLAKDILFKKALVNFDAYEKLLVEVKAHRAIRLVDVNTFLQMSKKPNTVILDTRSDAMYKAKHVKGAIHLDFTEFTADNLAKLIPNNNTQILIYCNNNFDDKPTLLEFRQDYFVSKSARPTVKLKDPILGKLAKQNELTLALNIPTYINLYGYGYKNVYELNELVVTKFDKRIEFEGTAVNK
jgi:hypothetical protein